MYRGKEFMKEDEEGDRVYRTSLSYFTVLPKLELSILNFIQKNRQLSVSVIFIFLGSLDLLSFNFFSGMLSTFGFVFFNISYIL